MKDSSNLDILRGLAVLFVLIDHTCKFHGWNTLGPFSLIDLGGVGVSFFFVHTCLVLMMSLQRQQAQFSGWRLAGSFYLRRAFRIYPLSILFIAVVLTAAIPARSISAGIVRQSSSSSRDIVTNLLLIQNLTYDHDIIGVLWTLPLELQMYLFLPPLFFLLPKLRKRWFPLLALWLAAVALACIQPLLTVRLNIAQYVPRFFPGVIAFGLFARLRPTLPSSAWPCWLLALAGVSVLAWSDLTAWMMCLLLGVSIPCFRIVANPVLRTVAAVLAKYSYGIYLCHVPCIAIAFQMLAWLPSWGRWSVFAALLLTVPVISFLFVEQPFIRMGTRCAQSLFASRAAQPALRRAATA